MKQYDDTRLSRFLCRVLRHQPECIGLSLDRNGWADIRELIGKIRAQDIFIDRETLDRIVREDSKQRYAVSPDGTHIRTNQGHSIAVSIEMEERTPPDTLYHGTAARFLDSIRRDGIRRMSRQYVHLSPDIPTAVNVGRRHGKPVVLVIDTAKMAADGYFFKVSENHVWQSDDIPWRYVQKVLDPDES